MEHNITTKIRKRWLIVGLAVAVLIAVILITVLPGMDKGSVIPSEIEKQLDFNPVLPASDGPMMLDTTTFKYEPKDKVMTVVGSFEGGKLTIAEQAYPEILIYDKFVAGMGLYAEEQTKIGTVTLTKPSNLNGKQVAVLNYRNTVLIFVQAEKELTNDKWKQIFNDFKEAD